VAFSLPFVVLAVTVSNSSATGAGAFLERVAARMLCSSVVLRRFKGFEEDSVCAEEDDGCFGREAEGRGGLVGALEPIANGPERELVITEAIVVSDLLCRQIQAGYSVSRVCLWRPSKTCPWERVSGIHE
jgi:hypothetical protein